MQKKDDVMAVWSNLVISPICQISEDVFRDDFYYHIHMKSVPVKLMEE